MEIRPILSSLRRSPTGAILVALQIALALAITVNSLYIVSQRLERLGQDSGMDVPNLFVVVFAPVGRTFNGEVAMREDLQLLRSLPGVAAATAINAVPLSGGGSSTMYYAEPAEKGNQTPGNYYEVDEHGVETLGVEPGRGPQFRRERGAQVTAQQFGIRAGDHPDPCRRERTVPGPAGGRQDRIRRPEPACPGRRRRRAHARLVAELGQVRPRRAAPGHSRRAAGQVPGAREAGPARRDDDASPRKGSAPSTTAASSPRCARSSTSPPIPTPTTAPWRCT